MTLARDDREINLAVAATILVGDHGEREGAVLVLDDVTPLFRAQRVAAWRDVARRLAHEIKNPLTPIQLSAERLRRHFGGAPPPTQALVTECTDAIITEVEALKGLVDEFAQFARLRAPRVRGRISTGWSNRRCGCTPASCSRAGSRSPPHWLRGCRSCSSTPSRCGRSSSIWWTMRWKCSAGPSGAKRPDGAIPAIVVRTMCDHATSKVRLTVSDNGPGVLPADQDKLFMPYYSTKGRGSGLGLAIVRRIVVEHGGTIEVSDVSPSGTTFTIELPCLPS